MIIIILLIVAVSVVAWLLRPRKNMPKHQQYAILLVTLLSLFLAITAVVFQLLQNATGNVAVSDISNSLFVGGLIVIAVAVPALISFVLAHKGEIAKGIGFGICIAFLISIIELVLLEWLGGV
jgi:hypothetical protein